MNVVFGSSGTVGSAVLHELLGQGSPCRAVYHSREPRVPTETARVDLTTGEGLVECLKGATLVFLATGDLRDQVAAEVRVVEAARRAGVRRLVKLSVLHAESEAFFHARVHRAVEREIERAGLSFTHLRPTEFMQNFVYQYGASIRETGSFRLPCGDNLENPVDTRDIGAVAAACLCSDRFVGQALDLCGPYPFMNFTQEHFGKVASDNHADLVLKGGKTVGISSGRVYSYYYRQMISLCTIDVAEGELGNEVAVLWGAPGTRQKEIRAKVERFPFYDENRNETVDVNTIPRSGNASS